MIRRGEFLRLLVCCAGLSIATAAAAQDSGTAPPQANGGAEAPPAEQGLEEIIVTAQKVQENLQKVPISITALSSSALASRGIVNAADLQGRLPGVEFQPIGNLFVTIRGIGTFNLQPGVDSAVAYTIDGNYIAHPGQLPPLLFDLERVEALRGPQGTLFGRNANAGAINQVTARPRDEFEASAALGLGDYALVHAEAMLNVPVTEGFALRGSFAAEKHSPYHDDGHNNENVIAARLRALIQPTSDISLLITGDYNRQRSHNNGVSVCPPNAIDASCAGVPWRPFAGLAGPKTDDYSRTHGGGVYAQLDWNLGFGTLTYVPTFRDVTQHSQTTPTRPNYILDDYNKLYTHELRLASNSSSPIKWVVGGYYTRERDRQLIRYGWDVLPNVNGIISFFSVDYYKSEAKAVFAQTTVPLTEQLRLTGGIRYTDETKISRGTANSYGGTKANPVLMTSPTGDSGGEKRVTWKVGAEFDLAPASLLYANVSTGFKSGGVNQVDASLPLPTTYAPETITAYEIGTKNRFLDGRLQLNAEAFHYDYRGFQSILVSFGPTGMIFFPTVNSKKARFKGGEIEGVFLPTPNDRFEGSVSLLDAKFTNFVIGANNYTGKKIPHSPPYTISLGYQHMFELGDGSKLNVGGDTRIVGKQYTEANNAPYATQSTYTYSTATVSYEPDGGRWSLIGWVRNIENKGVIYNTNAAGTQPQPLGYPLPPRTFGFTGRVRY